jgi:hypothetical protein
MNAFYQKLSQFGTLVRTSSTAKKMDMASYFTVMHPAYPVISDKAPRPAIRFTQDCPRNIKREVATLWKMVYG